MALGIDPELLDVLSGSATGRPGPPVGDVDSRRKNLTEGFAAVAASRDSVPGVDRTDLSTITNDGAKLKLSWYQNATIEPPGSAVLYFHGGGFIVSLLPVYDGIMRAYTKATGVPMLLLTTGSRPSTHIQRRSRTATPRCVGSPTMRLNSVWIPNALG